MITTWFEKKKKMWFILTRGLKNYVLEKNRKMFFNSNVKEGRNIY